MSSHAISSLDIGAGAAEFEGACRGAAGELSIGESEGAGDGPAGGLSEGAGGGLTGELTIGAA